MDRGRKAMPVGNRICMTRHLKHRKIQHEEKVRLQQHLLSSLCTQRTKILDHQFMSA